MASVNFDVETRTTPERPTGSNPNLNCPVDFVILLSFCLICSLKLFPELHQIKKRERNIRNVFQMKSEI